MEACNVYPKGKSAILNETPPIFANLQRPKGGTLNRH